MTRREHRPEHASNTWSFALRPLEKSGKLSQSCSQLGLPASGHRTREFCGTSIFQIRIWNQSLYLALLNRHRTVSWARAWQTGGSDQP
jgi:hypothetical protein